MDIIDIFKRRKKSVFERPKNNMHQGPPPTTPLNKTKTTAGAIQGPLIKKEKRHSSSRFNVTRNMELEMLPLIKGITAISIFLTLTMFYAM